ncbi:MAG: SGNH/GDSL hydrolase family protein [Actinobacteria bacterium]|nr:SGNH/GDSL hydrolase family protein [Actinomycetota bacterium]MBU1608747.1 SGNH/GDSL hydrolase family protein [Actinomycetota bacterium]MBU2316346.1 SGNH/GDSL hydrolase family protein [Actinomycetota bacterium]MBU2385808.1 SGNH/GDSL hydrolase family protein [Actinomycetota bacterium]
MRRHPALLTAATALATAGLVACASPAPTPQATGDGPVVAFYGDSYTLGTGASDPSVRWSTRISESRGWVEVNPSVNGLGFINNRELFGDGDLPSMIIDADPDIVFVTMGLNDNFSYSFAADAIEAQIDTDLRRLTEALPEARFIVVEPFWYTAERPPSVPIIIEWVRDAAERYGADYIPGASTWIRGRQGEMAADGLHPNDDGYAEMTRRMDAALLELGL